MNYFLYLVIGKGTIRQELLCSLMSLRQVTNNPSFEVVIYTDNSLRIPDQETFPFDITTMELDKAKISSWVGTSKFLLYLKPRIIKHFLNEHQGNVILLDTDTFFIRDPAYLFDKVSRGDLVMHLKENKFKKRCLLKEYISSRMFYSKDGNNFVIADSIHMWNSGVVGLNNSNIHLIDDILFLIEQICKDQAWHTVEQICISYFFDKQGRVISSDKYIYHYWFYRPTILLLKYFFNLDVGANQNFLDSYFGPEKEKGIFQYDRLPVYSMRLFMKFSKIYDWHFYSLPSSSYTGKLLRKEYIKDLRSVIFLLKCGYNDLLDRNNILEIHKPVFQYE